MKTFEFLKTLEGKMIKSVEQKENHDTGSWIRKYERDQDIIVYCEDGSSIKLTATNCQECMDTYFIEQIPIPPKEDLKDLAPKYFENKDEAPTE